MSFFYSTVFDGVELPEENTVLSNSTLDETLNRLKIVVEKGEVGFDEDGGQVAWFAIHTVRESDQRATIVHRRYRDFAAANDELRAAYKGSHLLSSFPPMPGRSWKLWEVRRRRPERRPGPPAHAPSCLLPLLQPGPLLEGVHRAAALAAPGLPRKGLADPAHARQPRLPDLPRCVALRRGGGRQQAVVG